MAAQTRSSSSVWQRTADDYRRQAGPVRREAWTFLALIAGCGIVWGVAGMWL
jgi:hypothetical protein